MAQNAFGMTSLYDPSISVDQAALERQMALAQALRKSALTPVETAGRQVGGVGYKISPWEAVAKALQGYQAGSLEKESDAGRAALGQKSIAALVAMLRGEQGAGPTDTGQPGMTPGAPAASTPAPDGFTLPNLLRGSAISQLGGQGMGAAYAKNFETPEAVRTMTALGQNLPEQGQLRTAAARKDALMPLTPGQPVFDPTTGKQAFQAPENLPPEVRQLQETMKAAGVDPASPQGRALFAQLAGKQVTHQPATTVSVNTEKGYAGEMAQTLAKQDAAIIDTAKSAPERITNSRNIKALLESNPITGTVANQRLALEKVFTTAGVIDGKRVANTETLASMLAASTLDAIKTSGLGAGQGFTDKDREFLEKARSGNIGINASTLRTLAELNERSGVASIEKANTIIRKLKTNPNMGGVGSAMDEISAPSNGPRVVNW